MKISAIVKSIFNSRRTNTVIAKAARSETRLNKAKLRKEQEMMRDVYTGKTSFVQYFEDLNFLGLPKWM